LTASDPCHQVQRHHKGGDILFLYLHLHLLSLPLTPSSYFFSFISNFPSIFLLYLPPTLPPPPRPPFFFKFVFFISTCLSLYLPRSTSFFLSPVFSFHLLHFIYIYICSPVYIYLLLTVIGLMSGDSVYKSKLHEHPQYNTVHIHKYNTSTWTLQNTRNRKYRKNRKCIKKKHIHERRNTDIILQRPYLPFFLHLLPFFYPDPHNYAFIARRGPLKHSGNCMYHLH
jgi:hypothetical protein